MSADQGVQGAKPVELVNLTIDGKTARVPKGTNLIEAAKSVGIEVPFYCYHPHLSIAGNCRMCQVRVKGAPKLDIACNTAVREGMEVQTHFTSSEVDDAQAATLEFILINHPLDCTVCDQAGHCKLQDYHFDYNARPSRFLENKEHKVKATPLGPTVMLDGERCIMCTRCVRFCDEVTKTSELGMLNRGDRSVIAVNEGKELNNPLSGTVVDLCPVGALTHSNWRFNTRIWFTKQSDSICPGCSTGCNTKVAIRDQQVVQVKARLNSAVNKEWLCDEGRYGFMRFLPQKRVVSPLVGGQPSTWEVAFRESKRVVGAEALVFVSPDLLLEEYGVLKEFLGKHLPKARIVLAYRERSLTEVEKILVSPDYAANFRAAEFSGLVQTVHAEAYENALREVRSGSVSHLLLVGQRAVFAEDCDAAFLAGVQRAAVSLGTLTDAASPLASSLKVVLPGRSILEKSGMMVNRARRLQWSDRVIEAPLGAEPEWRLFFRLSKECGVPLGTATNDRDLSLWVLGRDARLAGLTIASVKGVGVSPGEASAGIDLSTYQPSAHSAGGAMMESRPSA